MARLCRVLLFCESDESDLGERYQTLGMNILYAGPNGSGDQQHAESTSDWADAKV